MAGFSLSHFFSSHFCPQCPSPGYGGSLLFCHSGDVRDWSSKLRPSSTRRRQIFLVFSAHQRLFIAAIAAPNTGQPQPQEKTEAGQFFRLTREMFAPTLAFLIFKRLNVNNE
jgi:hypothetical protein